ncbi:MAG: hypothetical protein JNG89_00230 [Planctomycetaceae bacterium]|nr:hypothetical protein [Planctomycetaceae bacterium]
MAIEIPQPGQRARRVIAVHEQRPWWAPQLQHRFAGSEVAVRTCVRIEDAIDARPPVVIVVASGDGADAAHGLAELQHHSADAFVIVIVPRELHAAEWRLRELGASAVLADDVGADVMADVCRRVLESVVK